MADGQAAALARRHVFAATLGNALEFYDFFAYGLFAIQIGQAFFPSGSAYLSLMGSLATFGAGFLTRPIGAIVIGRYADRAGRKPAMLLSFVLIGCSMAMMALIPPYAAIGLAAPVLAVIARMAQGFSVGGEIGSNTAFLVEAAPPEQRGYIASFQGASQLAALVAGSLVGVVLDGVMPPAFAAAYGWRIAVLLGVATVPFGLWLRRSMPETLHLKEAAPAMTDARLRGYWRLAALGIVILGSGTVGSYVCVYAVTYAQDTLHLPAQAGFIAELLNAALGIPAGLLCGWLSDRIGRWPIYTYGNLFLLVSIIPVFAWITQTGSAVALILGMSILGVTTALTFGTFCAGLAEALPRQMRSLLFGTVYSFAIGIFGGSTQLIVTWLIHVSGSPMAPAWYLFAATLLGQAALMLFPETAPAKLAAVEASAAAIA